MQNTMQATYQMGFDTSFESRLATVDLSKVMQHVVDDHGLSPADAARAEDLYRKFLTLVAKNPGQSLVPPMIADLVWHAHITFTRQYMADCDKLFGFYLHHNQLEGDTSAQYATTVALMASQLGDTLTGAELQGGSCGN